MARAHLVGVGVPGDVPSGVTGNVPSGVRDVTHEEVLLRTCWSDRDEEARSSALPTSVLLYDPYV
ncbi:hypothetical protein F750_1426 [Streptomyces sp. PAMC 26508]|nr:hypothetical protein F750_1426 [Streptomyces sp. PAMC 26508]